MNPRLALLSCLSAVLLTELPAVEVRLAGPLTTTVDLVGECPSAEATLAADIVVPADAPADLQVGAFASEDGGGWRQSPRLRPLPPGRHRLELPLPGSADPAARAIGGLLFCATTSGATVRIDDVQMVAAGSTGERQLYDLSWDGALGQDQAQAAAGRAWQVRLRPGRQTGFALEARATDADGASVRVVAAPPAHGTLWTLAFTPPQPGAYRVVVEGRWGGERVSHELALTATGASPPQVQQAVVQATSQPTIDSVALEAPLRTCAGRPIAEAATACRVSARLAMPADTPDDLTAAAYVRDGVGRWRQSAGIVALRPGEQTVDLAVPAGTVEAGAGEAGIVLWSARISRARIRVLDLRVEALAGVVAGEPCLDRLRLAGVLPAGGGMTTEVGGLWSASVLPSPATGERAGLRVAVSARITDDGGRTGVVPAAIEESGRQRVDFHPSIPGGYTVELIGHWSDGRQVTCRLPRLTVTGDHPCRAGQPLSLRAPIATVVPVRADAQGAGGRITAIVLVPDGAPDDLAVAVAAVDHHDRWYESQRRRHLRPGINRIDLAVDGDAALAAAPGAGAWNEGTQAQIERTALVFTSAAPGAPTLTIGGIHLEPATAASRRAPGLFGLAASRDCRTGERWRLTLRPDPFPANPFDPEDFRLDLLVTTPEGQQLQLPGFYAEDMQAEDRGDRERLRALGTGRFEVRYRPRTPGLHRMVLQAGWRDRASIRCELPPLTVTGAPWDGFVRVDRKNPRFFAVDGRFFWPEGPNLRSVWDERSRERMHTRLTADRGSLAYQAYLRRFAAAGANACEIWMSAWNLALEWRRDWPGYDGVGRYNQENAWRLDRVLDAAWAEGMRINLVVNNHGQGSDKTDAEWRNNPYNRAAGGQLDAPAQLFAAPYALRGQEQLRRYLIGRYADHPAILGWKLWTEINLTNGKHLLEPWHAQAVQRWHALDPYAHPVASHWCGDYRGVDPAIARMLDYVCIDAYHDDKPENPYRLVHRLLRDSTLGADRGLAALGRPVLVTEYGGNWSGARNDGLMQVDHVSGPWVAFVSGHAGAPMLWWFEWIDQGGRWAPYGAIARFAAGEDLRAGGRAAGVQIESSASLWAAAWRTDQRVFGYVIDETWAGDGSLAATVGARLTVDESPSGSLVCEWWDPDTGRVITSQRLGPGGGSRRLVTPSFRRHLAWKLVGQP